MIPSETVHVFPIVPQHVAALFFTVDQQDERPSCISLNISHPLSLYHTFFQAGTEVVLLSHVKIFIFHLLLSSSAVISVCEFRTFLSKWFQVHKCCVS